MEGVMWQLESVTSPNVAESVAVVVARNITYVSNANRFQNLTLYLPETIEAAKLAGTPVASLPAGDGPASLPRYHVHIHGGAWRDPNLTSRSVEAAVANVFSAKDSPLLAIASINYTLSHFPTHDKLPYDTIRDNRSDPARDGRHPDHIRDVLLALSLLRSLGLQDDSYIMSAHSCGACLACQAVLQSPQHWGFDLPDPPRPAALLGLNGLYDLPQLVHGLGPSHAHLRGVYEMLLGNAFGAEQEKWPAASPAHFDCDEISRRVQEGKAPGLVVLDQSAEDQLVPMNQMYRLKLQLEAVAGIQVVVGKRCAGSHAAPWEQGIIIWQSIQDVLRLLE